MTGIRSAMTAVRERVSGIPPKRATNGFPPLSRCTITSKHVRNASLVRTRVLRCPTSLRDVVARGGEAPLDGHPTGEGLAQLRVSSESIGSRLHRWGSARTRGPLAASQGRRERVNSCRRYQGLTQLCVRPHSRSSTARRTAPGSAKPGVRWPSRTNTPRRPSSPSR